MADKIDMFNYYQPRMAAQAREQQQAQQLQQWLFSQASAMGQAAGASLQGLQTAGISALQRQAMPQGFGVGLGGYMSQPGMPHFGTVKEFRNRFKEYTKAEFRGMGSKPVIKEILSGMTKLNKEEIKERIAEHLALV